ncbi:hypothetical protein [Novosphingobium sp.]|uniref:hypothetical protein n=1 Tax=Novosphingobium sp. TaxID=1874826 RepID=UPI002FDACDE8
MSEEEDRSAEDAWSTAWLSAVHDASKTLKRLHETNPWPHLPLLPQAINYLMTELWDRGFSQTEIRQAFEEAVADMPRYAAGDEIRP